MCHFNPLTKGAFDGPCCLSMHLSYARENARLCLASRGGRILGVQGAFDRVFGPGPARDTPSDSLPHDKPLVKIRDELGRVGEYRCTK